MKTVTAALIIQPPTDQCSSIQTIRREHDKAYIRWMPHINLLYPFLDEASFDLAARTRLVRALSTVAPFELSLAALDQFNHGARSSTLFCCPNPGDQATTVALQATLEQAVPVCTELRERSGQFHPHLTLGQFRGGERAQEKRRELEGSWQPVCWTVDRVQLIRREGAEPFQVIEEFRFGQAVNEVKMPDGTGPAEECLTRVVDWIRQRQQQQQGLPKDQSRLARAITPLCYIPADVAWQSVTERLKSGGFISGPSPGYEMDSKLDRVAERDFGSFARNKAILKNKYFSFYSSAQEGDCQLPLPTSEEREEMAFDRAVNWLAAQYKTQVSSEATRPPCQTAAALEGQLANLCQFKVYVNPPVVLECLKSRAIFSLSEDDFETVHYHL